MTELKLPPHSIEIEGSLIAGVLLDPTKLDDVADRVAAEDFYSAAHREIFQVITWLHTTGRPIDAGIVWDQCDQTLVDGDYLLNLIENSRGTANLAYYADQVRQKANLRRLIACGTAIQDIGFSAEKTAAEAIQEAQALIFDIGQDESKDLLHIDEIGASVVREIEKRSESKGLCGMSTQFPSLDEKLMGLEPGNFVVIAGRPSMGKTTIAMNIAERSAVNGKFVVVFSLEMERESLVMRSYSALSDVHFAKLRRGALNDSDWPSLAKGAIKLKGKDLFIDDTPALTTSQIRSRCRRIQRKANKKIDLIVVDYIQIMGDTADGNDNARVTLISRNLKAIAKEFKCPLIALSQLNRGVEQRQNKRPTMSDLRDSGAVEQDADIIILMYRDEYYNEKTHLKNVAEAIIAKQRNGETGTVYLRSELEHMRFVDYSGDLPEKPQEEHRDDLDRQLGWR